MKKKNFVKEEMFGGCVFIDVENEKGEVEKLGINVYFSSWNLKFEFKKYIWNDERKEMEFLYSDNIFDIVDDKDVVNGILLEMGNIVKRVLKCLNSKDFREDNLDFELYYKYDKDKKRLIKIW